MLDVIKTRVVSGQFHGRVLDDHLPSGAGAFLGVAVHGCVGGQGLQHASGVGILMFTRHLKVVKGPSGEGSCQIQVCGYIYYYQLVLP